MAITDFKNHRPFVAVRAFVVKSHAAGNTGPRLMRLKLTMTVELPKHSCLRFGKQGFNSHEERRQFPTATRSASYCCAALEVGT
jgi:hypothetical protein